MFTLNECRSGEKSDIVFFERRSNRESEVGSRYLNAQCHTTDDAIDFTELIDLAFCNDLESAHPPYQPQPRFLQQRPQNLSPVVVPAIAMENGTTKSQRQTMQAAYSMESAMSLDQTEFDDFDTVVKKMFAQFDDSDGALRKRRFSRQSSGSDRDMKRKHSSNSQDSKASANTVDTVNTSFTATTTSTVSTDASKHSKSADVETDDDKARAKWGNEESELMWEGILNFGNEWRAIKKLFPDRSYDQVKDKGRRMLRQQRWKTGRTKNVVDDAGEIAKSIASAVLRKPVPDSMHTRRRPNSQPVPSQN